MSFDLFKKYLEEHGWEKKNDEYDELGWTKELNGLKIRLSDGLYKFQSGILMDAFCSVTTESFTNYGYQIGSNFRDHFSIRSTRIDLPIEGQWDSFAKCVHEIESWAGSVEIDAEMDAFESYPTSVPGSGPIKHLTVLALRKRASVLIEYKKAFESGDRLGFVNYINIDAINRAYYLSLQI